MARLLYACLFDVETSSFDGLHAAYRDWIENHYLKRRGLPNFKVDWEKVGTSHLEPLSDHRLTYKLFDGGAEKVGQIEWSFPAEAPGLRWRNEVTIGGLGTRNCIEHLVSVESTDYQVSPASLPLGSPGVIRRLCTAHTVLVGEMRLRAEPYAVDIRNAEEFLTLLESPLRRLPIIFVAPYASSQPNLVDSESLAQRIAGVAIVVRATDGDVTWKIADRLGRTLSCFDGGVRIYWPRFRTSDRPRFHPLFLGTRIDLQGPETVARAIERMIFGVACFRFVPSAEMKAVVRAVEEAGRANELESRKTVSGLDWEEYALELDGKLTESTTRLAELEAENANLKANQNILFTSREFASSELQADEGEDTPPASVQEAVTRGSAKCRNLIVLPSAAEAARNCPFLRPAEVEEALEDLNDVAADWVEQRKIKGSGGDLYQHLVSRGWGKRCSMHISDTTRTKYKANYSFEYKNEKQLFEPHITLGSGDPNSCASIHFILDQDEGKIVIGHVGRHLPNTKT
jgi:hypothetical protein